jgi:D-3-phosphoglycerate dehydrogenase
MRIVITDSNFASDRPEREVLETAGLTLERYHCRTEQEMVEAGKGADALLVQFAPATRQVLEQWTSARLIVRYGIGYDNVDVQAADERGIAVCNVPSYCLDEVADHTATLILSGLRRIVPFHESVKRGEWDVESIARPMPPFAGTHVGLIGFGRIGAKVAARLKAFGFQLHCYDPYLTPEKAREYGVERMESAEALFAVSDVISLHLPLIPETRHLIRAETIGRMKPTAIIVNTARGGLIHTRDLAEALRGGWLGGAALDVFEEEPLPADHPLRGCPNTVLTPHAAYYSDQSLDTLQRQAAEEIVRWARGEALASPVNATGRSFGKPI